jgi:hypothetical protein
MEGDREGIEDVWKVDAEVDFREVNWTEALDRCLEKNKGRFQKQPKTRTDSFKMQKRDANTDTEAPSNATVHVQPKAAHNTLLPRTAVLIRTWWDYQYDDEDIMYLRALISELSLASGGEYEIHFLIHVKDDNKQIWADEDLYQEVLKNALPAEFAGMAE